MSNCKCKIVIIGPSGGGKGTQAKLLSAKFGLPHISVGHLLREEIAKDTPLGRKIAYWVKHGLWAPDELIHPLICKTLEPLLKTGFILDGCPRTGEQAKWLDAFLRQNQTNFDIVIHLKVSPATILARRAKAHAQGKKFYPDEERPDETAEAIKNRLKAYRETIGPILEFYRQKGILVEVDGERSIEEIHREIFGIIKNLPCAREFAGDDTKRN